MDTRELEGAVRRAIHIGRFWRTPSARPRKVLDFQASSGTGVSEVRFLPGHNGRRIATISKGIWSLVTCWEIVCDSNQAETFYVRKLAEWGPKGMIFTGFVVNSDADSEGIVATSVNGGGRQCINILSILEGRSVLKPVCTIDSAFRPVALEGDLIAYSDDSSETIIMNWKTGTAALLRSTEEPVDQHFQYNRCLHVVFAHESVLVVRARSIELFARPTLHPPSKPCLEYRPIAHHSFGWIDGVSVSVQAHDSESDVGVIVPLSILLRAESDDPWTSDVHTLDLYILEPNPLYAGDLHSSSVEALPDASDLFSCQELSPYLFPPVHSTLSSPSVRGILRCTDIILGPHGTAIWIQPRPARSVDLTALDVHASDTQAPETARASETVAAAVFAGPLQRVYTEIDLRARTLWTQASGSSNWMSIDYIEELGRIVLGSSQGMVTVLDLT